MDSDLEKFAITNENHCKYIHNFKLPCFYKNITFTNWEQNMKEEVKKKYSNKEYKSRIRYLASRST